MAFPSSRYEAVRAHSPFALATAEAPPVAPEASFAANWFVSGIARIGDDNFVTIKSRDLSTPAFSLFSGDKKKTEDEVSVASVNWSETLGKSTVILRKGTETAKLEFNETDVHATPAAASGQNKAGSPVPNQPNGPRPAPGVNPLQRPQQPQNPLPPNTARPMAPGAAGAPPVHRRQQAILPPQ